MNPIAKLGNATLKAEFIISVLWPEQRPDDIDVWVEDPNGEILSYLRKDAGWLHLDRDDQGVLHQAVLEAGERLRRGRRQQGQRRGPSSPRDGVGARGCSFAT